ncbi:MAG: hypothetical protein ACPGVD_02455 [Flavobacteriales bacterium]
MKKLIYIFIVFGNLVSAQIPTDYYQSIDSTDLCKEFKQKAKNDIDSTGFLVPNRFFYSKTSETFSQILFRNYKFHDFYRIEGDLIRGSHRCYEKGLIDTIGEFYGNNFLDSISKFADSLDQKGSGFIHSSLKNDTFDLKKELIIKTFSDSSFAKFNDKYQRRIKLKIDSIGLITHFEYLEAYDNIILNFEKKENQLSKALYSIIWKHNKFKPATLEGKPMNSTQIIYLHPLFYYDEYK